MKIATFQLTDPQSKACELTISVVDDDVCYSLSIDGTQHSLTSLGNPDDFPSVSGNNTESLIDDIEMALSFSNRGISNVITF